MKKLQETFDYLDKLVGEFNSIEGKPLTPKNRKDLSDLIKKTVKSGMFRKDQGQEVQIWIDKSNYDYNMAPDIVIYNNNGNISICLDRLLKTMYGIMEQLRGD